MSYPPHPPPPQELPQLLPHELLSLPLSELPPSPLVVGIRY